MYIICTIVPTYQVPTKTLQVMFCRGSIAREGYSGECGRVRVTSFAGLHHYTSVQQAQGCCTEYRE